jgi:hypothetical protein
MVKGRVLIIAFMKLQTATCFSMPKEMCHLNLGIFTAVL